MPKLRVSPSGQPFIGNIGQILVCEGNGSGSPGDRWVPGDASSIGGIRGVGFDQPIQSFSLPLSGTTIEFPRTSAPTPLNVVLDDIVPGNLIEVGFNFATGWDEDNSGDEPEFDCSIYVSFNAAPVWIADYLGVITTFTSIYTSAGLLTGRRGSCSAIGSFVIPATDPLTSLPVSRCRVEVGYQLNNNAMQVGGTDFKSEFSATLKVAEYNASAVRQAGPGTLSMLP